MRALVDRSSRALVALLAALALANAAAQDEGVPRAPRIQPRPGAPAAAPVATTPPTAGDATPVLGGPLSPPSAARLAPLPEDRTTASTAPDEMIVIGQGWRVPDLGSRWRERQREAADSGRFHATALPLYDPEDPPLRDDGFSQNSEAKRHGYIELFRLRFGRREKTEDAAE